MKTKTNIKPASRLTPDSQSRLVAYAAAAGLGAFFGGQAVEGQVTESQAGPRFMSTFGGTGPYRDYFYLDIDGDGTNDFKLDLGVGAAWIIGTSPGNLVISPHIGIYAGCLVPWTNGVTINAATTGFAGSNGYLATAGGYYYGNAFYPTVTDPGPFYLGFSFTGGDGKTHFGYMNIRVNSFEFNYGLPGFQATVYGIYYNKTPNAAIVTGSLPPVIVSATSIQVGAKNAVTINFTSSDNAAASAFTLETSPVLGASASWTTDTKAVISSSGPGVYQAVTTGTGGPSQFYRIKH